MTTIRRFLCVIKSRNNFPHCCNYKYNVKDIFKWLNMSENQHSEHVISFYSKKTNQRTKTIRHISYALVKVVDDIDVRVEGSLNDKQSWCEKQGEKE